MGTWDTKINGSDSFLDIYQAWFDLYNEGLEPKDVSKRIQTDFTDMFNDYDNMHDSLFGLALAQWETKSLDPKIFQQVKKIIDTGKNIELWKQSEADDKTLKKREAALQKFLVQLSTEREKPKRRSRPKLNFTYNELVNITAPDGKKTFTVSEHFTNGGYVHTFSVLEWTMSGGGSVFYFVAQGKDVAAKWLDSQTLEITHDKDIVFIAKAGNFYFMGDEVKIKYINKTR